MPVGRPTVPLLDHDTSPARQHVNSSTHLLINSSPYLNMLHGALCRYRLSIRVVGNGHLRLLETIQSHGGHDRERVGLRDTRGNRIKRGRDVSRRLEEVGVPLRIRDLNIRGLAVSGVVHLDRDGERLALLDQQGGEISPGQQEGRLRGGGAVRSRYDGSSETFRQSDRGLRSATPVPGRLTASHRLGKNTRKKRTRRAQAAQVGRESWMLPF